MARGGLGTLKAEFRKEVGKRRCTQEVDQPATEEFLVESRIVKIKSPVIEYDIDAGEGVAYTDGAMAEDGVGFRAGITGQNTDGTV